MFLCFVTKLISTKRKTSGFTFPYTYHTQRTTGTIAFSHVRVSKAVVLSVGLVINGRLAAETQ